MFSHVVVCFNCYIFIIQIIMYLHCIYIIQKRKTNMAYDGKTGGAVVYICIFHSGGGGRGGGATLYPKIYNDFFYMTLAYKGIPSNRQVSHLLKKHLLTSLKLYFFYVII